MLQFESYINKILLANFGSTQIYNCMLYFFLQLFLHFRFTLYLKKLVIFYFLMKLNHLFL